MSFLHAESNFFFFIVVAIWILSWWLEKKRKTALKKQQEEARQEALRRQKQASEVSRNETSPRELETYERQAQPSEVSEDDKDDPDELAAAEEAVRQQGYRPLPPTENMEVRLKDMLSTLGIPLPEELEEKARPAKAPPQSSLPKPIAADELGEEEIGVWDSIAQSEPEDWKVRRRRQNLGGTPSSPQRVALGRSAFLNEHFPKGIVSAVIAREILDRKSFNQRRKGPLQR